MSIEKLYFNKGLTLMFSYSVLSPGNFLSLQKSARLHVLYRLVLFCLVALFLSILMSTRSLAAEGHLAMVLEDVPFTGNDHLLVKCNNTKSSLFWNGSYTQVWAKRCNKVFIVPVINGKQLTQYAHTYNPASYCSGSDVYTTYLVEMKPKPYSVHLGCFG